MFTRPSIKTRKISKSEIGFILTATPFWNDNTYNRSVILVVEHTRERSVGLIINKLSNLDVHSALNELNITLPLLYGGPFNKNMISFLHNQPQIPECIYLGNDLYIGGDYLELKETINSGKIDLAKIRFCAGNVEWSAGQLEKEIEDGKWWASEVNADEYFTTAPDLLWSYKLISDGHLYGIFDEYPDPSLN